MPVLKHQVDLCCALCLHSQFFFCPPLWKFKSTVVQAGKRIKMSCSLAANADLFRRVAWWRLVASNVPCPAWLHWDSSHDIITAIGAWFHCGARSGQVLLCLCPGYLQQAAGGWCDCGAGCGQVAAISTCSNWKRISTLKTQVDDVIVALDEGLRPAASGVAHGLRRLGRRVELVMEAKKMKWAFKVGLLLLNRKIWKDYIGSGQSIHCTREAEEGGAASKAVCKCWTLNCCIWMIRSPVYLWQYIATRYGAND